MRARDLSILILQHVRIRALQHTRFATTKTRRMLAEFCPAATSLDADQPYLPVRDEFIERADCIGPAADTGDDSCGQSAFLLEDLLLHLDADHALKITHHRRIRMRTK